MAGQGRRHPGLQARLAVACACVALAVTALLSSALFLIFRSRLRHDLRDHLQQFVGLAATTIDGDAHSTLRARQDEASPAYAKLKRQCQRIRELGAGRVRYVYTVRADSAGRPVFVVDGETDPALVSHLGDVYDDASPWLKENVATLSSAGVVPRFYTDKWGTWLSGYAPIYGSDGRREAVLGIDIAAHQVLLAERRFLLYALALFLATIPLALAVGWWFGRRLGAPVVRLKEEAERFSEGDFGHRLRLDRGDELGELALVLDTMADRLSESHRALEARVEERTAELSEANERLREEMVERERAEQGRHAVQERLELALSGGDLGLWDWDAATGKLEIDQRAVEMLGYAPGEVAPDDDWLARLRHPDDEPGVTAALRAHLEGHTPFMETEQRLRTKQGEWRWILSRGRCVSRGPDGEALRIAGTFLDITARKQLEEELRAISMRDGLTGLANRRAFDERYDGEWRRAARTEKPLSLIMCDVDHFKAFNDHHGHPAGDECLQRVAAVLHRTFLRALDFTARWGGEEFAVILAASDEERAAAAAERLREAVEAEGIPRRDAAARVVTISVGVATVHPRPGHPRELLQAEADAALYEAKRAGRNRVVARRPM